MIDTTNHTQTAEDEVRLEDGRLLFAKECTFVKGVVGIEHLPNPDIPEVAFAGRSNVGKSSFINALTGRKTLARTSNTPGRTREVNFFNLDKRIMLVDLPGYGFAKAPKPIVEQWTQLVMDYLKGRAPLRRVFILVDSRHGLKKNDIEVMSMLDKSAVSYQTVLTKSDKITQSALDQCMDETAVVIKKHVAAHPEILATSSVKGHGIAEARAAITAMTERWA